MVGQITSLLASEKVNIADMLNKHKGDLAYNIINVDGNLPDGAAEKIRGIEGVIMARVIKK
jgi:D-3-phosphoglycerate dehydrogenase